MIERTSVWLRHVVSATRGLFRRDGTLIVCVLLLAGAISIRADQNITLQPGWNFVDNQVNGTGGNSIDNTAFLLTPASLNASKYYQWECLTESFEIWTFISRNSQWIPTPGATWDPGEGAIINNASGSPVTITLHGTAVTPTVPPADYCGCGNYSLLGSQNGSGTYQSILGFNPVAGSQVFIYNPGSGDPTTNGPPGPANYTVYTYSGSSWSPGTPGISAGQAAWFYVPCGATNYLQVQCPSNIVVTSCTNVQEFYAPTVTDTACTNWTVVCTPPSGSYFASNTTNLVTCSVTDFCGVSNSCTFTVTVLLGPNCPTNCMSLTCPSNIVLTTCSNCAPAFFAATAANACCFSNVVLSYSIPSGSCFPLGTNTVQVTASDPDCASTPPATCSFTVTVIQGTNCGTSNTNGCCGPGLGLQSLQWLQLPTNTTPLLPNPLGANAGGTWIITNLPGYGNVLVTQDAPTNVFARCTNSDFGRVHAGSSFDNVPSSSGIFEFTENLYGPYTWSVLPGSVELGYGIPYGGGSGGNSLPSYDVTFYFLNGQPNYCSLVLATIGLAQFTTNTVSQPLTFRTEYDLLQDPINYPQGPSAKTELNGIYGAPLMAGVTETVISSAFGVNGGDDFNTGYAIFQPTNYLLTTSLPPGSGTDINGNPYPTPSNIYPYLKVTVNHELHDIFSLTVGYLCCSNCPTNCLVIQGTTNKTVPCGSNWTFDTPTATSCCTNEFVNPVGTATNVLITPLGAVTNGWCPNPSAVTQTWSIVDGCGNSNTWSQTVFIVGCCTNCLQVQCPTNKTVPCDSNWSFDTPTATSCCTNFIQNPDGTVTNILIVPNGIVTNGTCPQVFVTQTWLITDACGNRTNCSQTVTVTGCCTTNCLSIQFPTNKTVDCCTNWTFDPPTATSCCTNMFGGSTGPGTNVLITPQGTVTNGTCPQVTITETWLITDGCGASNLVTQIVTVLGCCTNQCCGPNQGGQTINWLQAPAANSTPLVADPLGGNTMGTWLITNLPCYGNVLITQTFPDNSPDQMYWFLNPNLQNVQAPYGSFQYVEPGFGPYSWGTFGSLPDFYNGQNANVPINYTVNFYFLDGAPNPCTLYLGVVGLASQTTATVSQPVVFRAEYDLQANAPGGNGYASANTTLNGAYGAAAAGTNGTVVGSAYTNNGVGDPSNTGWAVLQPTSPLATTTLPPGSGFDVNGNSYPALTSYPYLTLTVNQERYDGTGFTVGYCCNSCSNACLQVQCPPAKTVPCGTNWTFDTPTATTCCTNSIAGTTNNVIIIPTGTITNGVCPQVFVTQTWLITDACGNSNTCSQTVTITGCCSTNCLQVQCPANKTVPCDTQWTFDTPIASTCCTNSISGTTDNVLIIPTGTVTNGSCPRVFVTQTWLVTDACGDSNTCSQTVLVTGCCSTNCLQVQCPTNKTVPCSSVWAFDTPTATTCCSNTFGPAGPATNLLINTVSTMTNGSCPQVFVTRTWSIIDACGDSNTCSQTVTVTDCCTNNCLQVFCATNKTVACDSIWSFDLPIVTTCCTNNIPGTTNKVLITATGTITNGTCPQVFVTRTWTISDGCGDTNTCSQVVTVIGCCTNNCLHVQCATNKTVPCDTVWTFDLPIAISCCANTFGTTNNVFITQLGTVTNGSCPQVFVTRSWLITDACGDSNMCSQTVTVTGCCSNNCLQVQCSTNKTVPCGTNWTFDVPTATTCCPTNIPGTTNTVLIIATSTITNGACPQVLVTRTWSITDACGDSNTCSQTVTVTGCCSTNCLQYQCPTDKTVFCGTSWNFDPPANIVDACCTNYFLQFSDVTNSAPCPLVITRTWFITDTCSNFGTCHQTVTVKVTNAPTIYCSTNIVLVACTNMPVCFTVTASNGCIGSIPVVCTPASCTVFLIGTTTVHCTATDCWSNTATCSFTVTLIQTNSSLPPVFTNCPPNETVPFGTPWSFTQPSAIDPAFGTNIVITYVTVTNSLCPLVVTRTWTATDPCGNTATCSQTITVGSAPPCQIYNTGMYGAAGNVPIPGGGVDPNFILISYPAGITYSNTVVETNLPGSWLPDTAASQWVGPSVDTSGATVNNNVPYHYRLTFILCCTNHAEMSGRISADDFADVYLNSNLVQTVSGFSSWTSVNINSGFVLGVNTLDIYVYNYATFTGLRAELTNCVSGMEVVCPTNKTVNCGSNWSFDPPTGSSCCNTNGLHIVSLGAVTNGTCPKIATNIWSVFDDCGDSNICKQVVTIVDTNKPVISCQTNAMVVYLNTNCQLVIPTVPVTATDNCTPVCSLIYSQSPTNGTIINGTNATVTVTVTDLCGNSSTCHVSIVGEPRVGPQVVWPKTVTASDCIMPCVSNLLSISDCACNGKGIHVTQSPPCGAVIGSGTKSVTVTVTDCHGLSVTEVIPLAITGDVSFIGSLTNTGISTTGAVLPQSAVDPHYTLGPVASSPPGFTPPHAVVVTNLWPWLETPPHVSEWIAPTTWLSPNYNLNHASPGNYTYTNKFTLPAGFNPASASISGRWAADDGGVQIFLNGFATGNTIPIPGNGWGAWTPFTITNHFLAANTLLFVVTNAGTANNQTGLRVEYLTATICSNCALPHIISITPSETLQAGSSATFSVNAGGTPPLTYQWEFNGNPIAGATMSTLHVHPVTYANAGLYTVIVSNPCGQVTGQVRLTVRTPFPWPNAWWNVADVSNPLGATFGPDLTMTGTNGGDNFAIGAGTSEDLGLPNPAGQIVNVMDINTQSASAIEMPAIVPAGSSSASTYTVIMDIYQPDISLGIPSTLFMSDYITNLGSGGQDGVTLTLDASNYLNITGSVGGLPFGVAATTPLAADVWNRVALVVNDPVNGDDVTVNGYLNGDNVATYTLCQCCTLTGTLSGLPILTNSTPVILSTPTNLVAANPELFVSGMQFHTIAMTPDMLANFGSPDSGPIPTSTTLPTTTPVLSATLLQGTVSISWFGSAYVLQETTDLTSGVWADSALPFTETQSGGDAAITAVANTATQGPSRFYHLVFRP